MGRPGIALQPTPVVKKLAVLSSLAAVALTCGRGSVYRFDDFPDDLDGGDPFADGGRPDAGPIPCRPGQIVLVRGTPAALLVLDRSSSMGFRFDMMTTRWKALTDGLASALPPIDQSMQLGAVSYPLAGGGLACVASAALDFVPALGNAGAIIGKMRSTSPAGSTPTAAALDIAGPALLAFRAPAGGRALILATDGAPSCNSSLDPATCTCISNMGTGGTGRCEASRCLDDVRTVRRIAHYADAGLPTYVIGIQSETDQTLIRVLNEMAVAGGRPQRDAGTRFYGVSSTEQLDSALVSIRNQVGACAFLARSVPDRDEAMTVTLPGWGVIPFDPLGKAGWSWTDKTNGELVISGAACDAIVARMRRELDAEVACEEGP